VTWRPIRVSIHQCLQKIHLIFIFGQDERVSANREMRPQGRSLSAGKRNSLNSRRNQVHSVGSLRFSMNAFSADNLRYVDGILMTCSSGRSHRRSQSLLLLYHPSWPPMRSRCVSSRPKRAGVSSEISPLDLGDSSGQSHRVTV
jgi:hypothetical protein